MITREEFGAAYTRGFDLTVRFLSSRGLSADAATETAQAAWARGWERNDQLRDSSCAIAWVNSIALNLYRSLLRRGAHLQPLVDRLGSTEVNLAAIDVSKILTLCKPAERSILEQHHLLGRPLREIAQERGCSETAIRIRILRARRTAGERLRRLAESSAARRYEAA
ncbi:MAG TPA: sigma factor-like helix-turn-helix DNA-binding protein [Bryobacteraceae bacterium]|nr:sigma factor-like helix-turn-helix DNA-binding protein [Bryobacteraceae bacterium]